MAPPYPAGRSRKVASSGKLSRAPASAPLKIPIAFKFTAFIALLVIAFMLWQTITAINVAHTGLDKEINESGIGLVTALSTIIDPQWVHDASQDQLVSTLSRFTKSSGASVVQVLNVVVYDSNDNPIATALGERQFDQSIGQVVRSFSATRARVSIREFTYEQQPVRSFSRRIFAAKEPNTKVDQESSGQQRKRAGPTENSVCVGRIALYISAREIEESLKKLTNAMVTVSLTACLVAAASCYALSRFLTRHIIALLKDIRHVGQGDLQHQSQVHSNDELGELARAFNNMTSSLKAAEETKLAQKALDHELSIATKIQTGLLPSATPNLDGYDIASHYESAKEVGGDYYDFLRVDEQHLGMVVADVSGKSVPGSLIMTMTRSLLRLAAEREVSPARTVQIVNRFLTPNVSPGMFVTLVYLVLHKENREVRLVRCGHNAPLLYSAKRNKIVRLQPQGIALCLDREGNLFQSELKVQRFIFSPGDVLVCYTDGVTEAKNTAGEDYTEERLSQRILESAQGPAGQVVETVLKDVNQHRGEAHQSDDITLLVVKSS